MDPVFVVYVYRILKILRHIFSECPFYQGDMEVTLTVPLKRVGLVNIHLSFFRSGREFDGSGDCPP